MRTLFTSLIFLAFLQVAYPQSFEWIKGRDINYEMNPEMINYNVSASADGTIWYGGLKTFNQVYSAAMGDLFLSRYDAGGNLLQDYEISGSAQIVNIETDAYGFVYITGQYLSDLHFWDGHELSFTGSSINAFIAKVSPAGTVEWVQNLSELFPEAVPEAIAVYQGHIYLAHSEWTESNITEFDGDGTLIRNIKQDHVNLATGLALDAEGNIYVTGSCPGPQSSFGGVAYQSPFGYSIYLVKYSSLGNPEWVRFSEDVTCTSPKVAVNGVGNIIWAGQLNMQTVFDTLTLLGPSWVYDLFVTAYNPGGHVLWGFEVPQVMTGDASLARSKSFHIMPDQSVSFTGFTRGVINWGNGVVSTGTGFDYVTLVMNISPEGKADWAKTGGGSGSGYNNSLAIDMDAAGNLYLAGVGHGTIQFDTCSYTGASFYYPFLAKINSGLNTGIQKPFKTQGFSVYPNPVYDYLNIESDLPGNSIITLNNLSGEELMRLPETKPTTRLDVRKLPAGVYIMKVVNEGFVGVKKVVVE